MFIYFSLNQNKVNSTQYRQNWENKTKFTFVIIFIVGMGKHLFSLTHTLIQLKKHTSGNVAMLNLLIWKTIGLYWYKLPAGDDFQKKRKFYENKLYLFTCHSFSFSISFHMMFKCFTLTNKSRDIYFISFHLEIHATKCFIRLLILLGNYVTDWSLLFIYFFYFVWSDQYGFCPS